MTFVETQRREDIALRSISSSFIQQSRQWLPFCAFPYEEVKKGVGVFIKLLKRCKLKYFCMFQLVCNDILLKRFHHFDHDVLSLMI